MSSVKPEMVVFWLLGNATLTTLGGAAIGAADAAVFELVVVAMFEFFGAEFISAV